VGDHLYVQRDDQSCAQRLIEVAQTASCTVSAVQATRESLLPYYGVIGGQRISGHSDLYRVDTVMEKPTPTVAEQHLLIPGLRAGHYLCFFGMHVLTPTVMEILGQQLAATEPDTHPKVTLSSALAEVAEREQYLALEQQNSRYDLGVRYGLLSAQVALALNGQDRDEVLARLLELLAQRDLAAGR
jgi:UTP--glucose-1-phosphate uridylyltransferase